MAPIDRGTVAGETTRLHTFPFISSGEARAGPVTVYLRQTLCHLFTQTGIGAGKLECAPWNHGKECFNQCVVIPTASWFTVSIIPNQKGRGSNRQSVFTDNYSISPFLVYSYPITFKGNKSIQFILIPYSLTDPVLIQALRKHRPEKKWFSLDSLPQISHALPSLEYLSLPTDDV